METPDDTLNHPAGGVSDSIAKAVLVAIFAGIVCLGSLLAYANDQVSSPRRAVEVYHFTMPDGRPATLMIGGTR